MLPNDSILMNSIMNNDKEWTDDVFKIKVVSDKLFLRGNSEIICVDIDCFDSEESYNTLYKSLLDNNNKYVLISYEKKDDVFIIKKINIDEKLEYLNKYKINREIVNELLNYYKRGANDDLFKNLVDLLSITEDTIEGIKYRSFNKLSITEYLNCLDSLYKKGIKVMLPSGAYLDNDLYQVLIDSNDQSNSKLFISKFLLWTNMNSKIHPMIPYSEIKSMFNDDLYDNFSLEKRQILNMIYTKSNNINPCNILFETDFVNEIESSIKDIASTLQIPVIQLNVGAFGDAGDLLGFNSSYSGSREGRLVECIYNIRTTACIIIFSGLDDINKSSNNNVSVQAALSQLFQTNILYENYLRQSIPLKNSIIIGTCTNSNSISYDILRNFNIIKSKVKNDDVLKKMIRNELNLISKEAGHKLNIDDEAIEKIFEYCKADPLYSKYKQLSQLVMGHAINNDIDVIDAKLINEVSELFFDNNDDDLIAKFNDNYYFYDDNIKETIVDNLRSYLKTKDDSYKDMLRKKLEVLLCCFLRPIGEINTSVIMEKMNETHVGMEEAKNYISTSFKQIGKNIVANNILFASDMPGLGKTSLVLSACHASKIPTLTINCAQIYEAEDLFGTNIDIGYLLSEIKKIGSTNCIVVLEELDKCSACIQNSLLNLFDSQNCNFFSPFLNINVPFKSIFVMATANSIRNINAPLLDRFLLVTVKPYTVHEKLGIIRKYFKDNMNLDSKDINSELERYLYLNPFISIRDAKQKLKSINFDVSKLFNDPEPDDNVKSTVAMLGVCDNYGMINRIECLVGDNYKDSLLGNFQNVSKEAFEVVLLHLRNISVLKPEEKVVLRAYGSDIAKDGSSAGLAFLAAIIQEKYGLDLNDYGFTGEVTIHGKIKKIGGLYYKLLACKSVGLNNVLIPKENYTEYLEIKDDLKDMNIHLVETTREAIQLLRNKVNNKSYLY